MDGNALGATTDKAKVELEARQETDVRSGRCSIRPMRELLDSIDVSTPIGLGIGQAPQ
jgi:hypothetical protein